MLQITLEKIGPDVAKYYLSKSKGNRKTVVGNVEKFARMMQEGEWYPVNNGLGFDEDGVLIDGHNRLQAVIQSGCIVPMLVVRGIDRRALVVIDTGKSRSAANVIEFALPDEKNTRCLAAMARWLLNYDPVRGFDAVRMGKTTNGEICNFVKEHREEMVVVHYHGILGGLQTSICVFRYVAVSKYSSEKVDEFLAALNSGANLQPGDPVLALRNAIFGWQNSTRGRSSVGNSIFRMKCIFKAFKYWISGRPCKLIKILPGEPFPEL